MKSSIFFSAKQIETLRHRVSVQKVNPDRYPEGWSKSKLDPMKVLAVFKPLSIKKGYVLRAYQFISGSNGNGVVWAMSEDAEFPEPDRCLKKEDRFFDYPRPSGALDDFMEVIKGDGSELSYISASIFAREISELGSYWHGCSWSSHTIIDDQYTSDEFTMEEAGNWSWSEEKPSDWRPSVTKDDSQTNVNFYTYTGLMPAGIFRNADVFLGSSYCFTSTSQMIADCGGGYIY